MASLSLSIYIPSQTDRGVHYTEMKKTGVVMLPFPTASHMTSILELAKLLRRRDPDLSFTVLLMRDPAPSGGHPAAAQIASLAATGFDIRSEQLPAVDFPHLDYAREGSFGILSVYLHSYEPHVRAALSRSLSNTTALIVDHFATGMAATASALGIPAYLYYSSGAASLALMLHSPALDLQIPDDVYDMEDPVELPGLKSPVPPTSLPDFLMRKKTLTYNWFLEHGRRSAEMKAIIINTFAELEPSVMKALEDGGWPEVYPVGPLMAPSKPVPDGKQRHECLKWLDEQPPESVVLLCFGSLGSFGSEQTREIAAGIERSGHRFLWSLRAQAAPGSWEYPKEPDLEEMLPEGFLERTEGRGMVWPAAVPQVDILAHAAVGGFVTHCGWNSCLESLWHGVPMLAWPLYAEQHFNAVVLARELGLAVELAVDRRRRNFVSGEEVERGVRSLMGETKERRRVREKAREMMDASRRSVEEGGSSFESLDKLAVELRAGKL